MQSVSKQVESIQRSAESMNAAKIETIVAASAGDVVRQGDLYLICISNPAAGKRSERRQLAPGDTQGSRHMAEGECRVIETADKAAVAAAINRLVKGANVPEQLVGPIVECEGPTTIAHPEHGDKILPAGSTWAVVYQRQFAEEVRRVQD